jgi:hypothetical protein
MLFCLCFDIELRALLYDPVELSSYILDPLDPAPWIIIDVLHSSDSDNATAAMLLLIR